MQNNNGTRQDEVMDVAEYLEKLGLTQAVDAFLLTPDMHDLYHEMFVDSCEGLKAEVEAMPEEARELLLEKLDGYEEAENYFIEAAIGKFKKYLAEVLYLNEDLLGDCAGVAQCYKAEFEAHSEALENSAIEIAESIIDDLIKTYKHTWLGWLKEVENQEAKAAILKAALGGEIPGIENSIVVEVSLGDLMGDDEDDGETGDDSDED